MEQQTKQHSLTVENRSRLTATQVASVDAFSPTRLKLTYNGGKIVINGSDMKIINFSKSSGDFSASGEIVSVAYSSDGLGIKKLFK